MQNSKQKFRQNSIVFEKTGILSEILKTWTSSNYPTVQYFLLNFPQVSYLQMSTKACVGFFLFVLDVELFATFKKT